MEYLFTSGRDKELGNWPRCFLVLLNKFLLYFRASKFLQSYFILFASFLTF